MNRESILAEFEKGKWKYEAFFERSMMQEFQDRICSTVTNGKPSITYSDLVDGVTFRDGKPFVNDVRDWNIDERAILGDCLGYLSYISYRDYGFMVSALVVNKEREGQKQQPMPSKDFFKTMKKIGAMTSLSEESTMTFWIKEVNKAVEWYQNNPKGFSV